MAVKISISCLLVLFFCVTATEGQELSQVSAPTKITWTRQPGVKRYRLQVATDEQFRDVLFDRLVEGEEFEITELTPGLYYWRVAPQNGSAPGRFVWPVQFQVKPPPAAAPRPTPKSTPSPVPLPTATPDNRTRTRVVIPGWTVATGEIVRLISAPLRSSTSSDFIGVNSEGTVYALDGARGSALWVTRFHVDSSGDKRVRSLYNHFTPLLLTTAKGARVLVEFDSGVRALDGATGREVWSSKIAGRPTHGTTIGTDVYLISESSDKLFVLDGPTGQMKSKIVLKDHAVGYPVLLTNTGKPQLFIPLRNGMVELRGIDGDYEGAFRVATEITTPPVVVQTSKRSVLLLGLKNGLAAFDGSTADPLGRIAIEDGDFPVNAMSLVDLDGDKTLEVIMTTNGGRVIAVDVADGKIRWSAHIGSTSTPSFTDLDADARPDIVLAGKDNFAIGLSGLTGSRVWDSGEETSGTNTSPLANRSVAVATVSDGRVMVVGNDRAVAGLRAFEVPKTPVRSNP